ncbi:MAG: hypothetical protein J3R72DRAFT_494844 [Linnemannia gamsii]|nr:MAG: hypothetical protein J3R72DRAFT_494844 [Linnemannia gamsii]
MHMSWKTSLFATAACLTSLASIAQATIACDSPGVFGQKAKPGDVVVISIMSDNISPTLNEVTSLTASLNCNLGNTIATFQITPPNKPFNYKIPSIGNITTLGGKDGPCIGNSFHFSLNGTYPGAIGKFGPAKCVDIELTPGPYVPPAPITTAIVPITPTTSKNPLVTTTTTLLPSETPPKDESGSGGKLSTAMIAVIVLAVVLILILVIVAIFFRRRYLKKRMESAAPDNNSSNTKMSPSKEEKGDQSPSSGSASMKTLPKAPQLYGAGGSGDKGGYVDEDSYAGYEKRQPHGVYYEDPQDGYNNTRQPHGVYYEDPQDGYDNQRQPHGMYYEDPLEGYYKSTLDRYVNNPQEGYNNNPQGDDYYDANYGAHPPAAAVAAAAGYGYATHGNPQGHYLGLDPQGLYPGSEGGHAFYKDSRDLSLASSPSTLAPGRKGRKGRKIAETGAGAIAIEAAATYYPPPPPVRGPTAVALRGPTSVAPPTLNYGQLDTGELILPDTFSVPVRSVDVRAPQEILPPSKRRPKSPRVRVDVTGIPMMQVPSNPHTLT